MIHSRRTIIANDADNRSQYRGWWRLAQRECAVVRYGASSWSLATESRGIPRWCVTTTSSTMFQWNTTMVFRDGEPLQLRVPGRTVRLHCGCAKRMCIAPVASIASFLGLRGTKPCPRS
ncbi:hypothetical protein EMO91_12620 [Bifidobacterium myosotis]|uniref:Uncharacterized protein n=1 Tax=Bifidobacterium myosotis TaxID=1630166 RepID=A0A5M9ZHP2_9BIFI|nr:hypothetical protein EMO91_12620 [Bifidobacterium myosotis]